MKTIHEIIKGQITEAMRAKDAIKLDALRSLVALFSNELILKKSPEQFLNDPDSITLIKRSVKQHKDSIEQFGKGGRTDLVEKEKAELAFIEAYLPKMMSKDDIRKIAETKIASQGMPEKSKVGQFIGILMKELKGNADGTDVKTVVDEIINK